MLCQINPIPRFADANLNDLLDHITDQNLNFFRAL